MKYLILIIFFFIKFNLSFSQNIFPSNKSSDSCKVIKLDSLPSEISTIIKGLQKFNPKNIENITKTFNKALMFISFKKQNDSTNIYVVTYSTLIFQLFENIPSYYYLSTDMMICIYTGNENLDKLDYACIEPLLNDGEKYSEDKFLIISKEKLIFGIELLINCYKTSSFKFILEKGKIIYSDYVGEQSGKLYKNNAVNKITTKPMKIR
jgi:hypothetical protein